MFENVQKFVRKRKKGRQFYIFRSTGIFCFRQSSGLCFNDDILTNLGPISVDLIFYDPNGAYLRFWRIEPKMSF